MWKQKEPAKRWGYVFYEESGEAPARDWLADLPSKIRQTMLDTLDAVLYTKNPPGAYLPNRWHSMKDVAGIDMGAYFEARDQHGEANYRLRHASAPTIPLPRLLTSSDGEERSHSGGPRGRSGWSNLPEPELRSRYRRAD